MWIGCHYGNTLRSYSTYAIRRESKPFRKSNTKSISHRSQNALNSKLIRLPIWCLPAFPKTQRRFSHEFEFSRDPTLSTHDAIYQVWFEGCIMSLTDSFFQGKKFIYGSKITIKNYPSSIFDNYSIDIRRIFCTPTDACSQFQASLVKSLEQ